MDREEPASAAIGIANDIRFRSFCPPGGCRVRGPEASNDDFYGIYADDELGCAVKYSGKSVQDTTLEG
jgi:hypothetical protein